MKNLKLIIKSVILEATRYKRETGENLERWKEKLNKYESSGEYYVHFSNVPKVGLYLINDYQTPIGFYAYPLQFYKMEDFAVNRPYAIVFKIKPNAKLLKLPEYTHSDYERDLRILKTKYPLLASQTISDSQREAYVKNSGGYIWNLTRILSMFSKDKTNITEAVKDIFGKEEKYKQKILKSYIPKEADERGGGETGRWSIILNKTLGYDGAIDDGNGIIHHSEPYQAVFFNTNAIEIVDIIKKTSGTKTVDDLKLGEGYSGQVLISKDFSNKEFFSDNFSKTKINKSNFSNTLMLETPFSHANVIDSDFSNSELLKCSFSVSKFSKCNFTQSEILSSTLDGCIFQNADFTNSYINGCNILGTRFKSCNLENLKIVNCQHSPVFQKCNFKNTTLENLKIVRIYLTDTQFENCMFSKLKISQGLFEGSNFVDTKFENSSISYVSFKNANLSNTIFKDCRLNVIDFRDSNLENTKFTRAEFIACNFSDTNLANTDFINCVYTDECIFPKEFNPSEKGLVKLKS